MNDVLTFILAGGRGQRLQPLTRDRTKPAVPFGGMYRIIDFTLSNCVNSGLRQVHVLMQYKSHSLQSHLRLGWNLFVPQLGEYIDTIPAQQRIGLDWYRGTADAIYQNLYILEQSSAKYILILSGDHVYKMNYNYMLDFHKKNKADVTVSIVGVSKEHTTQLGIVKANNRNRVTDFIEKPESTFDPKKAYASMGIYIFNKEVLIEQLKHNTQKEDSSYDFGKDILPSMVNSKSRVFAYPFKQSKGKEVGYWRDVGTIDSYYNANMDLISIEPSLNLYDSEWPIRTYHAGALSPVKTVFVGDQASDRVGSALDSLICGGCIISGGKSQHSILSPNVRTHSFSEVYDSILMEGVDVGRHAKIRRAIIDKDVKVPENTVIGHNLDEDRKKYTVTDSGIVVIAKKTQIK